MDPLKGFPGFQHDLFSEFSQMHGRAKLLKRYLIIYKGPGKRKIGIIRPVPPYKIDSLKIRQIVVGQPLFSPAHDRCRKPDPAIAHQQGKPVQQVITLCMQIQNMQPVQIQFILIDVTIGPLGDRPFPGKFSVLCAVKPGPIIVKWPASGQVRSLYDLL